MEKPRILLADDHHEMRSILFDMLAPEYDVSAVCTGKELYTLMSERRELYSAVVCDVVMPHWNGDEAVKMAQTFGSVLPVIFISGNVEHEQLERVKNCVFLRKPVRREELLRTIKELIEAGQ